MALTGLDLMAIFASRALPSGGGTRRSVKLQPERGSNVFIKRVAGPRMCAAGFVEEDYEDDPRDDPSLIEEVKQLRMEFGDRADNVAALRADKLFRDGDFVAGTRWLKIFRMMAMAHGIEVVRHRCMIYAGSPAPN